MLFTTVIVFITLVCPCWLIRIQEYKLIEINGPWDKAKFGFDLVWHIDFSSFVSASGTCDGECDGECQWFVCFDGLDIYDGNCDSVSRALYFDGCQPLNLRWNFHFIQFCLHLLLEGHSYSNLECDRPLRSVTRLYQADLKLSLMCLSVAIEAIWSWNTKQWGWSV